MAELTNKLTVVDADGTSYQCLTYTEKKAAIPALIDGGDCLQIKNNNVVAYLGLCPYGSANRSEYSSPLVIKKNNKLYYVETKVISLVTITLPKTTHQSLSLTYYDRDNVKQTVTTKNGGEYEALYGTRYTISAIRDVGYTTGTINVPSSGNVIDPITVTISAASKEIVPVNIVQTANQTITVTCNGKSHTTTFNAEYGDPISYSIKTSDSVKWVAGTIKVNNNTVLPTTLTLAQTVTATPTTLQKYTLTCTKDENATYTITGVSEGTGGVVNIGKGSGNAVYIVNYGDYTISVTPDVHHTLEDISIINTTSGK